MHFPVDDHLELISNQNHMSEKKERNQSFIDFRYLQFSHPSLWLPFYEAIYLPFLRPDKLKKDQVFAISCLVKYDTVVVEVRLCSLCCNLTTSKMEYRALFSFLLERLHLCYSTSTHLLTYNTSTTASNKSNTTTSSTAC